MAPSSSRSPRGSGTGTREILPKLARNNLQSLATNLRHECGQRGYICTQITAHPHPDLRKVRSTTATLLPRTSENFSSTHFGE